MVPSLLCLDVNLQASQHWWQGIVSDLLKAYLSFVQQGLMWEATWVEAVGPWQEEGS